MQQRRFTRAGLVKDIERDLLRTSAREDRLEQIRRPEGAVRVADELFAPCRQAIRYQTSPGVDGNKDEKAGSRVVGVILLEQHLARCPRRPLVPCTFHRGATNRLGIHVIAERSQIPRFGRRQQEDRVVLRPRPLGRYFEVGVHRLADVRFERFELAVGYPPRETDPRCPFVVLRKLHPLDERRELLRRGSAVVAANEPGGRPKQGVVALHPLTDRVIDALDRVLKSLTIALAGGGAKLQHDDDRADQTGHQHERGCPASRQYI
jgi:hypothetical protein